MTEEKANKENKNWQVESYVPIGYNMEYKNNRDMYSGADI